jgi:methionyl-tRNA formyltransferase
MTNQTPTISARPRIGWVGFHVEGVPALRAVLEAGASVAGVVTLTPEKAALRSGVADYHALCAPFDVPVHEVASINDESAVALLRAFDLDLLVVLGWSQILSEAVLSLPRIGTVGAHASLLPHNRGSAPVNWAILRGERLAGNSLIWLSPGVDDGDLIDQMRIPITPYDSCASIYEQVALTNRTMILRLLDAIARGERPGRAQPHSDEAVLLRRRPKDGAIDWSEAGGTVYDFVRALTGPYPGAFSWLDGVRWTIWRAAALPARVVIAAAEPGQLLGGVISPTEEACGQLVATGRGAVILLEVENDEGVRLAGRALSEQPWCGKRWQNG